MIDLSWLSTKTLQIIIKWIPHDIAVAVFLQDWDYVDLAYAYRDAARAELIRREK